MFNIFVKKYEPGRLCRYVIRKYHQYKPKDRVQSYDGPLPHDIQVFMLRSLDWFKRYNF